MATRIISKEKYFYSSQDFKEGVRVRIKLLYHSPRKRFEIREGVVINSSTQSEVNRPLSGFNRNLLEMRVNETFKGRPRRMPRTYDYRNIVGAWILE